MSKFASAKQELMYRLMSLLVWAAVSVLSRTVRLVVQGDEEMRRRLEAGEPSIVVTWHGRTLIPVWLYGPRNWVAMISLSRDGEYQSRIFNRFGWQIVRGSSGRGGVRALASAARKLRSGATLAFTPDGPKGPSHAVHPGVLFLSQKAGCPIFPVGISAFPRWSLPTWDRYQIPRPFSRCVMIYGEPIQAPASGDLDILAEELAKRICELEQEAERQVVPEGARQPCVPAVVKPPGYARDGNHATEPTCESSE